MRKFLRSYLLFTRSEWRLTALLCLILAVLGTVRQFRMNKSTPLNADEALLVSLLQIPHDTVVTESEANFDRSPKDNVFYLQETKMTIQEPVLPLANFDPDTVSAEQWIQWGVPHYVAERIVKYISKGGHINSAGDLGRIYGFPEDILIQLQHLITDGGNPAIDKEQTGETWFYEGPPVELNTAGREDLERIGFDDNDAIRIIKYRDGLGGFTSNDQLYQVYGVEAEHIEQAIPFLLIDKKYIRKLNLNTADSVTLSAHIYITDALAAAIVNYRNSTGKFYAIDELYKVRGMYPALLEKLKPYLQL